MVRVNGNGDGAMRLILTLTVLIALLAYGMTFYYRTKGALPRRRAYFVVAAIIAIGCIVYLQYGVRP